jgi:ABC-type protease/lipase transport system fused ATPase/permease subunit
MWDKITWLFNEILNTFSNKKSFLSSKRIERFLIFTIMLFLTVIFIIKSIIACTLGATDFIIIIGTWLGYGGWSTVQISKDKKFESDIEDIKNDENILKD